MSHAKLLSQARRVQRELEYFYALEAGPDVGEFVRIVEGSTRETLVIRCESDALEIALLMPIGAGGSADSRDDEYLQLVEGVSHFVYVAERARVDLPTTELELELQAEVDKFVIFAFDGSSLANDRARDVRRTLYDDVVFIHSPESVHGQRYRLANHLAARLARRLVERPLRAGPRKFLQRFYRAGQSDKLRIAGA